MAAVAQNLSFASPLADAKYTTIVGNTHIDGFINQLAQLSTWQIALTILLLLVAYDQSQLPPSDIIIALLMIS